MVLLLNPVGATGSGLPNTNTPGTYTFYAECAAAPGCRTATDFVIKGLPNLSSSLAPPARCSNVFITYTATSDTAGTTFVWSRAAVAGISNAPAGGSGASITEALVNTTSNPVNVVYAITLTTPNGCTNTQNVTVTINPNPTLTSSVIPPARCNNTPGTYTATSATTGTTFSWTRTMVVGISNAAASGNTAAITETLVNTTANPVNVIYAITMTASGCSNTQNVTLTVNPTPNAVATPSSQTACSTTAITAIILSGATTGTTYAWTRDNTVSVTGIAGNGSGNISGTLTNTTTNPITVTFTITPTANSCQGTPITATVLVNPSTVISTQPSGNNTYCPNATAAALSVSATGAGTLTYQWYSNTVNDNTTGTIITGATNSTYIPPTTAAGTNLVLCKSNRGLWNSNIHY
jgi:hypothetical protein